MRPKRSVETPPTNPAGAPRRAIPTAMLRQDPPTTGTVASRPSTDLTGRKSTRASPQLSSMALVLRILVLRIKSGDRCDPLHRITAVSLQLSHQPVNSPLCPVEIGQSRRGRFAQPAHPRH